MAKIEYGLGNVPNEVRLRALEYLALYKEAKVYQQVTKNSPRFAALLDETVLCAFASGHKTLTAGLKVTDEMKDALARIATREPGERKEELFQLMLNAVCSDELRMEIERILYLGKGELCQLKNQGKNGSN